MNITKKNHDKICTHIKDLARHWSEPHSAVMHILDTNTHIAIVFVNQVIISQEMGNK
jgi:hypothetical protein